MLKEQSESLLIMDNKGKVTILHPDNIDMILSVDNSSEKKLKFKFKSIDTLIKRHCSKSVFVITQKLSSNNFEKVASFIFPGTSTTIPIKITMISYTPTGTSYDVRIYDINNNVIIVSNNYTNKSSQSNSIDLDTLSLPANDIIAEIHVRYNGSSSNKYVYIDEFILYYDLK